ncbi:DUF4112 domain-containing protein [bacterium]|nr:DUF4112 domain-containing protein [bacterium]
MRRDPARTERRRAEVAAAGGEVARAGAVVGASLSSELKAELEALKRLEKRLDSQFRVLGVRFGLDGIVGLAPVVGDVATAALGLYLILRARRLGVGRGVQARMLFNLGLDLAGGAIPVIGDVFDFFYKSNTANVRLLMKEIERREKDASRRK